MYKNQGHLNDYIRDWYNPVEYDIKPYEKMLHEVSKYKLNHLSDNGLKEISFRLKRSIQCGDSVDALLPEAFALVREAHAV